MLKMGGIEKKTRVMIYGWMLLAVLALAFAGLFAILLALARTPVVEELLPFGRDYIFVALVGHVVLAFVIWFLAFQGFLWVYTSTVCTGRMLASPALGTASLVLSGAGLFLIVVSALLGLGRAELVNYVPVLITPFFYAGLLFFATGILLVLINTFLTIAGAGHSTEVVGCEEVKGWMTLPTFGMLVAGVGVLFAYLSFALSGYFQYSTGKAFLDFERLFWGGGHVLQFTNTISMVTAWVLLAGAVFGASPVGVRAGKVLFAAYIIFIIPSPFIYFIHDTATQAYKDSFTGLMQWGHGFPTAVFAAAVVALFVNKRPLPLRRPGLSALVLSMVLFTLGGLVALRIRGVNTIIPAHYHFVIGAVTIAFMGFFYESAPLVGRRVHWPRLAAVQTYVYFLGIVLFASGLFTAGVFGVMRKTYAGDQNLDQLGKLIGMGVMGLGGLVSIIGGVAFVLNALFTLLRKKSKISGG